MTAQPQGHAYLLRNIPADLLKGMKVTAAAEGISIRKLIFAAVQAWLNPDVRTATAEVEAAELRDASQREACDTENPAVGA